jgi:TRAP transporter TAXI family solute receptor
MRLVTGMQRISWRDLATTVAPVFVTFVIAILVTMHYLRPAPPTTVTITSGPDGSAFRRTADKYQKILARSGVTLNVLPSEGSKENLERLLDPNSKVEIGFVQGGLAGAIETEGLVSLGSLFYEPLYIFYRNPTPINKLSELRGRRIAIGPDGSGTHALALALLKANGIEGKDSAQLTELSGKAVTSALLERQIDAAFMMSDSSAPENMRELLHAPDVRLFEVTQLDAYTRRFRYLSKLELGPGSFDLGSNIPSSPITLLAPTVELVAREGLHPALSDLLVEAAREVHGRAGLLHTAGEFPAPLEHEYPISDDAARFYKSGKSFSYRHMPFWLATLIDRILVVLLPTLIVLVPALRLVPAFYRWRIRSRIHRRYAELMALERVTLQTTTDAEREPLRHRLEEIEKAVINLTIPAAFADQVYVLREHIKFVRERLAPGAHRREFRVA